MTLILGIEDPKNDRAIICSDSAQWSGELVWEGTRSKIWRSGDLVTAMAGNVWMSDLARALEPVSSPHELASEMLKAIAARQQLLVQAGDDGKDTCSAVIARGREVYSMGNDFGVARGTIGVAARGVGSDFVIGAALALRETVSKVTSAIDIAARAMQMACVFSSGCRAPIRWMATDGTAGVWE